MKRGIKRKSSDRRGIRREAKKLGVGWKKCKESDKWEKNCMETVTS